VIGHAREGFTQPIGEGLLVVGVGAHLVGLIHDDEVPVGAEQALLGVLDPGYPGDRGDHLVAILPGVKPVGGTERLAADDLEALAELVLQLPLPLEGEVRRCDNECAADQAAGLQFFEQEPRHDRLAGARVVGQQEADAREFEEVAVDRLELVRERIDAGDRQREEGIVFVGQSQPMGFDPQPEQSRVAVEGFAQG
jgi:hypothetical protein